MLTKSSLRLGSVPGYASFFTVHIGCGALVMLRGPRTLSRDMQDRKQREEDGHLPRNRLENVDGERR